MLVDRPSIAAVFGGGAVAFDLSDPADIAAWDGVSRAWTGYCRYCIPDQH
jgi:hypothetical protein